MSDCSVSEACYLCPVPVHVCCRSFQSSLTPVDLPCVCDATASQSVKDILQMLVADGLVEQEKIGQCSNIQCLLHHSREQ